MTQHEATAAQARQPSDETLAIWAQGKFIDETGAMLARELIAARAALAAQDAELTRLRKVKAEYYPHSGRPVLNHTGCRSECWYCFKPGFLSRHSGGYNIAMCDNCRGASDA